MKLEQCKNLQEPMSAFFGKHPDDMEPPYVDYTHPDEVEGK